MNALIFVLLAATPNPEVTGGNVTLPLQELMPLMQKKHAAPPVGAVVSGAKLEGRLTPTSLEVTARIGVDVLTDGEWQRVPLFKLSPGVVPLELPTVEDGALAAHDGALCFFSRHPGHHTVEVKLSIAASKGTPRVAKLEAAAAMPPALLELKVDPALMELLTADADLAPENRVWTVSWKPQVEQQKKAVAVARPPLEPKVAGAQARFVSTLEGKGRLNVSYALELDRPQPLSVKVPGGYRLERVILNGAPRAATAAEQQTLVLEVAPARAGETSGTLELLLTRELGVFHLSGRVDLALPALDWPVSELQASAFLPAVFDYHRIGGSLEPAPEAAAMQGSGVLPGKQLAYRQFLVAGSAPTLELEYSVALEGRYFRANAAPVMREP